MQLDEFDRIGSLWVRLADKDGDVDQGDLRSRVRTRAATARGTRPRAAGPCARCNPIHPKSARTPRTREAAALRRGHGRCTACCPWRTSRIETASRFMIPTRDAVRGRRLRRVRVRGQVEQVDDLQAEDRELVSERPAGCATTPTRRPRGRTRRGAVVRASPPPPPPPPPPPIHRTCRGRRRGLPLADASRIGREAMTLEVQRTRAGSTSGDVDEKMMIAAGLDRRPRDHDGAARVCLELGSSRGARTPPQVTARGRAGRSAT